MINFLAKRFIKDYDNIDNPEVQSQYISLSGVVGLVLNIILFFAKLLVGLMTNSLSIVSDSFNNLSDSLTSVVAIVGSFASRKPADEDHPQGHGRIEDVASLIVGLIIMAVSFQLFKEAIGEIKDPIKTDMSIAFVGILIFSNLVKFYMYKYNHALAIKLKSSLNDGVAKDSLNDTIATTGILIGGLISHFASIELDGVMGLLIAILVFKTGLEFASTTISLLLGERASDEVKDKIVEEILKGKYIKGYHDLYIHSYGRGRSLAHAHVDVPKDLSVYEMHLIVDQIERNVMAKTGVELVLHMDPRYMLSEIGESNTKIYNVLDSENYEQIMDRAAGLIQDGDLVVVPTETVYGLGGDGLNPEAIKKIFKAKERQDTNPLILHIGSKEDVEKLAIDIPDIAYRLMDEFWPGPLTLVLKKSDLVPDLITAGSDSVGIRMPDNRVIRDLIARAGRPLACPSANISGKASPTNVVDAYEDMKGKVSMILNDGSAKLGLESTIVDLTGKPAILRLGYIDVEKIRAIVPGIKYDESQSQVYSKAQMASHYKTEADVFVYDSCLVDCIGRIQEDVIKYQAGGKKVGVLAFDEDEHKVQADHVLSLGSKGDLDESARLLFSKLRDFDRLKVDVILVQGIKEDGIGKTIMSRLDKASGGKIIRK